MITPVKRDIAAATSGLADLFDSISKARDLARNRQETSLVNDYLSNNPSASPQDTYRWIASNISPERADKELVRMGEMDKLTSSRDKLRRERGDHVMSVAKTLAEGMTRIPDGPDATAKRVWYLTQMRDLMGQHDPDMAAAIGDPNEEHVNNLMQLAPALGLKSDKQKLSDELRNKRAIGLQENELAVSRALDMQPIEREKLDYSAGLTRGNEAYRAQLDAMKPQQAPAGYQFSQGGGLTPIPGGPHDPANNPKYLESVSKIDDLMGQIKDYRQFVGDIGGGKYLNSAQKTALQTKYLKAQMALKDALALGALTGPDLELITKMLQDPTDVWNNLADTVMPGRIGRNVYAENADEMLSLLGKQRENLGKSYGVTGASSPPAAGGSATVVRRLRYTKPGPNQGKTVEELSDGTFRFAE